MPILPNDLINRFTGHLKEALQKALSFAVSNGRELVEPGDLIVGLLHEKGALGGEILKKSGCSFKTASEYFRGSPTDKKTIMALDLTEGVKKIIEKAVVIAHLREHKFVGTEHLVAAIAETDDLPIKEYFRLSGVNIAFLREQVEAVLRSESNFPTLNQISDRQQAGEDILPSIMPEDGLGPLPGHTARPFTKAPGALALDSFARDLTQPETAEKLDPVIGREDEIQRVIEILIRRTKCNPVLLGEPGVGKTAIVEGLAKRLANGDVPDALHGMRLLSLDLASTVAGTMYRGEFEARLKQIVEEAKQDPNLILFIDEIHNIVGAGSTSGSLDAANILKPALARGEIRCIGATTWSEYKKHIEPDAALERRFQPVLIQEPTAEAALKMLEGLEDRYAKHHGVTYHPETLRSAVDMAERFLTDRLFPDKAIDLIDEAAASVIARRQSRDKMERLSVLDAAIKAKMQDSEDHLKQEHLDLAEKDVAQAEQLSKDKQTLEDELDKAAKADVPIINPEDVANVVARMSHVPLSVILASERKRLAGLEERLSQKIMGQPEQIQAVADLIRRARLGLHSQRRPKAAMMFIGPSGTGKTELARTIALELFGREDALLKLDMSEFSEAHSISKLIGSPAGYVGYRESAKLSDSIRKRPHSVICFDEFEKAHADVLHTLLQVLEDGILTDATGRTVSFRNTYIILTSNAGSESLGRKGMGFGASNKLGDVIQEDIKNRFRPELVNRLDRIIVFNPLTEQDLRSILERELDEMRQRLMNMQKVSCEISDSVRDWLMRQNMPPEEGARAIRRLVEREITSAVSKFLIQNHKKNNITISATNDKLRVK